MGHRNTTRYFYLIDVLSKVTCCVLFLFGFINHCEASNQKTAFMTIKIISRAVEKNGKIILEKSNGSRHYFIVSDILPYGVWEVGPDNKGMIVTTNTIQDLREWHTNVVTQNCLDLGGDYIRTQEVEINKKGLFDAIKLYEEKFVGKFKYRKNDNYAISTVIYGAGGPKLKL